jgi:N-acyl-D-aspartate/D-glutamate deacylase
MWDPLGTSSCWHGVTTVVMGNCGFTLAPARADERHLVVRNLERAEDISPEAMAAGIDWTWETFPEYLDAVDRRPKGINYAAYVGHSALRTWAMGERAFDGAATHDEVEMMTRALRDALHAGAIGFTTSRNDAHQTADDHPVASRLADWDEVRRLVGVMGDLGVGMFEFAPEPSITAVDSDRAMRDEFWDRMRTLAIETGVPMTFGVQARRRSAMLETLSQLDLAAPLGARFVGQTTCRASMTLVSFETRLPFDRLAEWAEVRARPLDEQRRLLHDPDVRRRLVTAAEHGVYRDPAGPEVRAPDYDWLLVLDRYAPPHRSVAAVAAERGVSPVEVVIDLGLETDFAQLFAQAQPNDDDLMVDTLHNPRTVMTFSDSGAHVSLISEASIQTHLLSHWVREREEFTLEEAVRMLTLAPARAWGFPDRGLLQEGSVADLNVFDPATVEPELPRVAVDLPGGARRLTQRSRGFLATVVGGEIVHQGGEHTGALPGRLLRGPLAHRAPV